MPPAAFLAFGHPAAKCQWGRRLGRAPQPARVVPCHSRRLDLESGRTAGREVVGSTKYDFNLCKKLDGMNFGNFQNENQQAYFTSQTIYNLQSDTGRPTNSMQTRWQNY